MTTPWGCAIAAMSSIAEMPPTAQMSGVQNVGGAFGKTFEKGFLRVDRLAGDDRNWHGAPHLGDEVDILRETRLLVPVDAELGEAMPDADRMRRRKPPVRLDQQFEIRPQRLAHRPYIVDCEILVAAVYIAAPGAGERVEFCGGEAHCLHFEPALDPLLDRRPARPAIGINSHALARGAADQVVDRQSGALADDVPGGDLDRTPRRHQLQ